MAAETADPDSVLSFYRRALALRQSSGALRAGDYRPLDAVPDGVFAFERADGDGRALVLLHFGDGPAHVDLPERYRGGPVRLATHGREREGTAAGDRVAVPAWGGLVLGPA